MLATRSKPLLSLANRRSPLMINITAPYVSTRWENPVQNFTDFKVPNRIGMFEHYRLPKELLDHEYNYPVCRDTMGIRWPGFWFKKKFVYVQEMEPELIVPDLTGFELKPYVSYRTEEVDTKPFTAKELFEEVYASKVERAYLEKSVEHLDVSQEQIDAARLSAMQTGADLFEETPFDGVRAPLEYIMDKD